ncbi:cell filamentation protein Fic [Mycolicibacterium sp. 018/SC-01/001]|uniref:Fic/DOC family protein n=1 Tax=Mycolicibacterium sp. 018/SC-01/001 TaxID=2592069 RepID=UPI00117ED935|nr:Fic family protein [Mycolicibacterium sp. 018/SC-01/001]TRW88803.1 cell filamentation protein Fic [Mycolicibacterium sp. 018/SC-01/001]
MDAREHVVATTVAVHRIEGWRPDSEHLDALTAIARGELRCEDHLASYRERHPPSSRPRRRMRLGRPAPYLIPGTQVLRNEFGVTTADALADLEYMTSAARMAEWLCRPPGAVPLDVRDMHRHLFGGVYAWAGRYRTVDLRRGRQAFGSVSGIGDAMTAIHDRAQQLGGVEDEARLAYELARIYADYNQIHPFREGNGRAGALLLLGVAARCGRRLDLTGIDRTDWYAAAIDSMPLRRDGRASHRPFLYLLKDAVR